MAKGINFFFIIVVTIRIFKPTLSIIYPSKLPFLVLEYPAMGFKGLYDAIFKAVENVVEKDNLYGQWVTAETLYTLTHHRYPQLPLGKNTGSLNTSLCKKAIGCQNFVPNPYGKYCVEYNPKGRE